GWRFLVNVRRRRLRIGRGTFLGELLGRADVSRYLGVDRIERGRRGLAIGIFMQKALAEATDRTARFPFLDFLPRAIGEVAHALGVRPGAIGLALDQRRAAARTSAAHRLAGDG